MTTSVETTPEVEVPSMDIELRVADRCDAGRCGAQAFVVTMHLGRPLFWCKHDYEAHEADLKGHVVIDRRNELTRRPTDVVV